MWIALALTSAATLAVVNLADKRLLDRHLPGLSTLYLWVALITALYTLGAIGLFGLPRNVLPATLLAALASGFCLGAGYALLFVGLRVAEASRAVAISQIYPIFVALLAVLFLGERLVPLQWAAIVLVVLGAILVSLPGLPHRLTELKPSRGAPVLLFCGLLLGTGFFAAKLALVEGSFAAVFIYQQLGTLLVFLPFIRPKIGRQLFKAMGNRQTRLLLVIGEGVLPLIIVAGALQATNLGPVSLVSAFLATTPFFVFLLATLLSYSRWHALEETITRRALALKFVAITMIVAGVSALGVF